MILRDHHEAFEIDLRRIGVRLSDFYSGRLSVRELSIYARNLPNDSAVIREADPDGAYTATWGPAEYMLADLFDLTMAAATAGSKTKAKPYPRPDDVVKQQAHRRAIRGALVERAKRQQAALGGDVNG